MTINLKSIIEDESAVKSGGFTGAVFLTYTLNLVFFEKIIAPALEQAGCSNVLIITDQGGYAEAVEMGARKIAFAGIKYVCEPISRQGYRPQHAKMLWMVGPKRGRLLIGSGNLTLHGYSQNLETYSHFEYNHENPEPEAQVAFHSTWKLIQKISKEGAFSSAARRQLDVIQENVGWFKKEPVSMNSFFVWDNYDSSLWEQFVHWREKTGLMGSRVKVLRIFSPYYDQDGEMLKKFIETLLPDQVNIHLSIENTTLDGKKLSQRWPDSFPMARLFDTKEVRQKRGQRLLHAKMVVGVEEKGSWCIAGSANMTYAAFGCPWGRDSNLELVTFRWFSDPAAFDYFIESPITIVEKELNSLQPSTEVESLEKVEEEEKNITLTELIYVSGYLSGHLNWWPASHPSDAELVFLRSGERLGIHIDEDLSFRIPFNGDLKLCEAAYVSAAGIKSPPRLIDYPDMLREYGSRSYHERIQAKLDTVLGAESLFHELMEYLFERVNPGLLVSPTNSNKRAHPITRQDPHTGCNDIQSAPAAEQFVVPERDASGRFMIGHYTQEPYSKSIQSLRDLLSIVLLKLTTSPVASTETNLEEGENTLGQREAAKQEEETLINARQRLCKYLIDYCKRYGRQLCEADFVGNISPAILLDNHLTLSRILVEFLFHVPEFKKEDFTQCYWWIWAPLVWPSVIGLDGESCLKLYSNAKKEDDFNVSWNKLKISSIFAIMTSLAFDQPPLWSAGLHCRQTVKKFLTVRELIKKYKKLLSFDQWEASMPNSLGISQIKLEQCKATFKKIDSYLPPARERLAPIIEWVRQNEGQKISPDLLDSKREDLQQELQAYQEKPGLPLTPVFIEPDDEEEVYCPKCGGALKEETISAIKKGRLVLCSINSDAWLYIGEKYQERIF